MIIKKNKLQSVGTIFQIVCTLGILGIGHNTAAKAADQSDQKALPCKKHLNVALKKIQTKYKEKIEQNKAQLQKIKSELKKTTKTIKDQIKKAPSKC